MQAWHTVLSPGCVAISALFAMSSLASAEDHAPWIVRQEPVVVHATNTAQSSDEDSSDQRVVVAQNSGPPATSGDRGVCRNGVVSRQDVIAMIQAEAKAQGADERLALAVAEQESDFGQNNNSDAGARGPMQLMPDTASQYRVEHICDARENVRGGVAFLKDLQGEFGGNIMLIAAAYNAGQKRVYQARGIPANSETVNYVARITNAYYDYKNGLQHSRLNGDGAETSPHVALDTSASRAAGSDSEKSHSENEWIGGTVLYVSNPNVH